MPFAIRPPINFTDFEALRDGVLDHQSDIVQLGRGRMRGSITHFALDEDFRISTGKFTLSMRATGKLSDTHWCLGYSLASDGPAIGLGSRYQIKPGELGIVAPGEDRFIKFSGNTEYLATMISPAEIEAFLSPSPGAYDLLLKHRLSVLHTAPVKAIANIMSMRPLLDRLIRDGHTMPDDVLAFHKRNMMELLTLPIRDTVEYRGVDINSADSLVRKVEDYQNEIGTRPLHVSEICERFYVHPRKLQRVFEEVVGMGVVSYLRQKRLNEVHTALRRDGRDGTTIRQVAINHGFADLGRFAQAYQHAFGELPSQTLKRNLAVMALTLPFYVSFFSRNWLKLYSLYDMAAAMC